MIIVRLYAGLGNQMFQYAAGLALAESRHTVLKLDVNWYKEFPDNAAHNRYALSCLNVTEQFATNEEIERIRGYQLSRPERGLRKAARLLHVSRFIKRYASTGRWHHVDWRQFDVRLSQLPDNSYFDGLCHSERYFSEISELVRLQFSFRYPPSPQANALADQIQNQESIAVHFRRGDYVTNERTARDMGVIEPTYYQAAFRVMRERFPRAKFYVFSDDIEAVAREISPPGPHEFVRGISSWQSYDTIRLMSLCDHAIISNSTFAWWGAWLNPRSDKVVIAPTPWSLARRTSHIVPESWLKLSRSG